MVALTDPHTSREPVLALVGPTASGKTEIAVTIAAPLNAEIVSVDSMQVYRGMDIGTAKPPASVRLKAPYHLIDLADTGDPFSAGLFKVEARRVMSDIFSRGKIPILVGGSGLYYRAVVDDLDFPAPCGPGEEELENLDEAELLDLLQEFDPASAAAIPLRNRRRLIRAISVARRGGRLISDRQASWIDYRSPYRLLAAGLEVQRELLYDRIGRRVEQMITDGLVEEVRRLSAGGLSRGTPAGEALGYRQVLDYLQGGMSVEEAIEEIKARTRNYAKRQLTWFKKDPRVRWFRVGGFPGESAAERLCSLEKASRLVFEYFSAGIEE